MNSIINFTLRNKFAVWLMTLIVVAAGLYSGLNMKLETIPNISTPILSITTIYPGATPEEVGDKVSQPIEQAVQSMNGVKVVSSTSYQNASSVQIEYDFEKNMDEAKNEAEEALSSISFPEGVQEPETSKLSFNAFPILTLSVSNDEESLAALTKTVKEKIAPALEGINGVSTVQISGQQVDEVELKFDQDKMKQLGLQEAAVQNIIKGSDVTVPLGLYTFKDTQKSVKVDGNITTISDLKDLEIPAIPSTGGAPAAGQNPAPGSGQQGLNGAASEQQPFSGSKQNASMTSGSAQSAAAANAAIPTVKLGDIAEIKEVGKAESISRTNGKEAIGLSIVKASDANTVDVAIDVKEKVKEFNKEIDGLETVFTFDQAEPIEHSVSTMLSKALFGAAFAMVIILLFLRDLKSTLISMISIPLSLLIAILLLKQMDITLNMMTLGAMTVAIGRVVDDSIVVIENIYRRMSLKGETLKGADLIREATKEMFMPILSSTIVTIAVFLPLGLVKGMIGELFLPFALTIVFALSASLLVAVTIVPMLAHSLFKKGVKVHEEQGPGKLANGYKKLLNWTLNHKIITSGIAILMLAGSLFLIPVIGVSFLSSEEEKMMIATFKPDPGVTREQASRVSEKAENLLLERDGVKTIQLSLGSENPMNPGDSNSAIFYVQYEDDTPDFEKEKEKIIKDLQSFTTNGEWLSQNFSSSGASNEVKMYVYGDSMKDIEPIVKDIQNIMKKDANFKNVDSSMSETYQEYTFTADQKKLSSLGLTAGQIGMELSPQRERPILTKVSKDDEELNVYIQTEKETYNSVTDLTNKTITSPLGKEVQIKDVVQVKEGETSNTVSRRDGKIYVEVSGELKTDNAAKASADLQKKVDKLDMPSSIKVDMGGVSEDINESFKQLGLAMLAAIAIVYLVLVITFGGGLAPFAILFSLPFTIIGGLLGLLIAGETLSVSAMIGALMLIGIVVTNAIVLIDRVIHNEKGGLATREALLEAGSTRLRPILMTAIATIGALIPLALGLEGSGIISKGLGVTVIGGLTSSTLLTLVIVPIVYEALSKVKNRKRRKEQNG
ncbi:HAE1 family hydrophobic/amphiphilic exporter-1 [Peribacillus deserti]|uniref:HAE1 family hydrophobic/amphiphilic exporter-1 n=1 Tax=Peribacillus deserti TaxID=673318 RepID=A0ABS2QKJ0_9BACI|nr:efflux RND transporter permease subunit [Peribacillus deserti]MBM7693692.1 HAE1 family hydrophobic/amphiphilic exporter-1 [Peribacillus deserti]